MRDYEFYVSGALRPILAAEGWRIEAVANGRWTCELDIASMDGTFHAAIGDDVWPAEKVGIVSAAAGTPSVLTTDEPHGCVTGQLVTVGGNPAIAPGTYRVTVRSPTTVSIPVTAAGPASGGTLMRRIFGGEITTPTTAGFGGAPWAPTTVQIQAGDYSQRFERRYLNTTIPAGTLKSQLAVLATAVPGVALHPFQVDGPAMPQITLTYTLIRDVLNQLSVAAGDWPWELDEYVFLRMWAPGTDVCPINLIEGDGHALGDIAVYPTRDQYANRVLLRFSDVAHAAYAFLGATAQFADGDQVVIGSTTYTFKAAPAAANDVGIGPGVVDSLNNLVAGIVTGATGGSPDTQVTAYVMPGADAGQGGVKTIALEAGAAGNSIGVSTTAVTARWFGEGNIPLSTLALGADQALTNVAIAADPSSVNDPWEALVEAPDVTSLDDATPLAAAYLQSKFIEPRIVTFKTLALGLRPGQALTITLPSRGVNNTFLITQVNTTCQNVQLVNGTWEPYVIREVTAVEALALHAADRWRALYQQWSKTAPAQSGAATSIASPGGGGGGGGGIAGAGTPGRIVKWTSGPALADAALFEAGGNIGLNTTTPGTFQGGGGSTGTVFQVSSVTSHAQFVASAHNPGALAAMNFEVGDAMAGRRVIQQFYHGPTNALRWRVLNETNGAVVVSDLLALTNTGNVGIGTATPSDGGLGLGQPSLMVQGTATRANLVLSNSNAAVGDTVGSLVYSNFGTTRAAQIDVTTDGATNSGSLQIYTFNAGAAVTAVRIRANGNVGIGTSTPVTPLDVVGRLRLTGALPVVPVSGVGIEMSYDITNTIGKLLAYDRTGGAYKPMNVEGNPLGLNVQSGANVGIGTTAPLATLDIETADTGVGTKTLGLIIGRSGGGYIATERAVGLAFRDANNGTLTGAIAGTRTNSSATFYGGLTFHVHATASTAATAVTDLAEVLRLFGNSATDFYVLPGTGSYQGNIGTSLQKWASLSAGELHVESLVAQQTITTIGGRAVIASGANLLVAQSNATDNQMSFKYNDLQNGDILIFEGLDVTGAYSTEFVQVASSATSVNPPFWNYSVTRNYGGAFTAHGWPAGAACMNTGQAGAGFIDLYAINSLKGPTEAGPTIVGNLRTSNAYNDWKPRWAIGNLNGLYGYTSNLFGVAIGAPAGTNITIEANNGIQIRSGTVPVFTVDTGGNLGLAGNLTMSTNGVFKAGATTFGAGIGWWLDYNGGTPRFRVGNPAGKRVTWDGGSIVLVSDFVTIDSTGITIPPASILATNGYKFAVATSGQAGTWLSDALGSARDLMLYNVSPVGTQARTFMQAIYSGGSGAYVMATDFDGTVAHTHVDVYAAALTGGTANLGFKYAFAADGTTWITNDVRTRIAFFGNNQGMAWDGLTCYPFVSTGANLGSPAQSWGTVYSVNFTNTSDARLKQHIRPTTLGTEFLLALQPRAFEFRASPGRVRHGFVAQEVAALHDRFPDFAGVDDGQQGAPPAGFEEAPRYLGLDYIALIAPIVRGFQELAHRVAALEQR